MKNTPPFEIIHYVFEQGVLFFKCKSHMEAYLPNGGLFLKQRHYFQMALHANFHIFF